MSEPVIAGEYTLNIDVPGEIKELKGSQGSHAGRRGKRKTAQSCESESNRLEHDDRIHLSFACNIPRFQH